MGNKQKSKFQSAGTARETGGGEKVLTKNSR